MRFVQPVVLVAGAVMYVVIFTFSDQLNSGDTVQWNFVIAGAWNLLLLVATIISIVDGVRKFRAKETRALATDALVVKLASIPFFVLNYLMLAFLFLGGAAIILFGGPLLWLAGAIGSGLTYLAILSTSVYTWAAIAQLRRERIIGTRLTVLYAIMSLIFVTDIAAGVMVFGHYRRRPRLALVVLLLSVGLVILAFGIVVFSLDPTFVDGFDPISGAGYVVAFIGIAVIIPTGIVAIVRRSSLRAEAQLAGLAPGSSIEHDTAIPVA
jgi:hypothetical protein